MRPCIGVTARAPQEADDACLGWCFERCPRQANGHHFTSAALPRAAGHLGTMGMLLAKMWSSFFGLEEFKILIVGLNNAGKTTTLYKLCASVL